ncbi:MAG: hypothetical protein NDP22_03525 [Crenarchaeota archaeon]|nr:hypothetical protein [Thermoproteota archaeon]
MNRRINLQRVFLMLFFMFGIIVSSKIKFHKIFGLDINFSLLAIFGPVVDAFLPTPATIFTILGARALQILTGITKSTSIISWLMYIPILFASCYFGRLVKRSEDPFKYLIVTPAICIALFVRHPIGAQVWYFSLYWLIPIVVAVVSGTIDYRLHDIPKIYLYSLGATFIDHCVGSVMFLYTFNIPAIYWNMAIPLVIIERALFAGGVTLLYLFLRKAIPPLREVYVLELVTIPEAIPESIPRE